MPGTLVTDALAVVLDDGGATTANATGSAGWVNVDWPGGHAALQVVMSACTDGGGVAFVILESSDASDGANPVTCGAAGPFDANSANATYLCPVFVGARGKYVRASIVAEGTVSVTPATSLVEPHYLRTAASTAGLAYATL